MREYITDADFMVEQLASIEKNKYRSQEDYINWQIMNMSTHEFEDFKKSIQKQMEDT